MYHQSKNPFVLLILAIILVAPSCTSLQPPTPTNTPKATATRTLKPTKTPKPSATPRPTGTPNLAATHKSLAATQQMEKWNAEVQTYFDAGYLKTTDGIFRKLDDFEEEWAQLHWYQWWSLGTSAGDFFMSGHFRWSSAYRSADISGCGFAFGIQENHDNYAVFLDQSQVYFIDMDHSLGYYRPVGPTRGTGRVKFGNPADKPAEADFTVIVKEAYAYVLVDGEVMSEYTLSQSRPSRGDLGLTMLSGTNKDYGTRCVITNLHYWKPKE